MIFYKMVYSYNISRGKRGVNLVILGGAAIINVIGNYFTIPLLRFACVLTQICVDYLGMPSVSWCGNVDSKYVSLMMKEIAEAGNIQDSNVERELSSAFVDRSQGGLFALLHAYANNMTQKAQRDYALARKLPVLLPVFWIYYPLRWKIRSIRGERKAVSFLSTFQMANKRKQLYNWLGLFH